jgi:AcrR family transcriptional regulator
MNESAGAASRGKNRTQARRPMHPVNAGAGPGAIRRKELKAIAARRFAEFGFDATTTREIAHDAQMLSGSIYYYFSTKEDMLHEVIRGPLLRLRDSTIRIAGADYDAEHKIVAIFLLSLQEMLSDDQDAYAILYNERKLLGRRAEFGYVPEARSAMYHAWRAVLSEGVEAGLFRPGTDGFLTISTIVRMLSTCVDWYRDSDVVSAEGRHHSFEEVIDFNLDFILSAIRIRTRIDEPIPRAKCEQLARIAGGAKAGRRPGKVK